MAKKLNKLIARVATLESAIAGLLSGKKAKGKRVVRKAKKAKKVDPVRKRKTTKISVSSARKPTGASKTKRVPARKAVTAAPAKVGPTRKAKKKVGRRKATRVSPPTIEQLAPSGAPEFVTPLG